MNRNRLKLFACLSMLIDHVGLVLFPDIEAFRLIGRLAMPIFAFFIGEGCLHTRNRRAYFLRVFILGIVCQAVYIAEAAINGGNGFYLNILLTFSVAIPLCYLFIYIEKRLKAEEKDNLALIGFAMLLALVFLAERGVTALCDTAFGIELTFDYGFAGICLPMFALLGKDKRNRMLFFTYGLLILCAANYGSDYLWTISTLLSLILLWLYNGKGGERNLKYFFYAFYPLHLVVIYGIDMLI